MADQNAVQGQPADRPVQKLTTQSFFAMGLPGVQIIAILAWFFVSLYKGAFQNPLIPILAFFLSPHLVFLGTSIFYRADQKIAKARLWVMGATYFGSLAIIGFDLIHYASSEGLAR